MASDRSRGPGDALGHAAELEANLVAGEQPRLGGLRERHASAHEKRLHARDGRVHRLGDLVVGEGVDLAQQQRGALRLGQLLHVGHDVAELLTVVDGVRRRGAVVALEHVHRVLARGLRPAQMVQAAVARDPVEPRSRIDRPVVGTDRVEGRGEDLLEHVLRVLARAEHVAAESEQPRLVALHERLERAVMAASYKRHELLVSLEPEQGRTARERRKPCRVLECGCFQVATPVRGSRFK